MFDVRYLTATGTGALMRSDASTRSTARLNGPSIENPLAH
jgi:hypothetical protein